MQAILMAGGQGRRLRPITAVLPKPLVPIGDISVLEMVLRQLRWYGFDNVVLCVGYRSELIMAVVGDGRRYGLDVRYEVEEEPLGTIGPLARIDRLEDNFLVMNGDICTDLDFGFLLRWHKAHEAPASVSLHPRREKLELGIIHLSDSGERLTGFEEKPEFSFYVAMGVNAFRRSVVELIPSNGAFGFDDLMSTMLARNTDIRAFRHDGFWLDIGRPDDYQRMLDEFPSRETALLPDSSRIVGHS